jgi:hypothetical protein
MTERFQIEWQGILIEVRYLPNWSASYEEVYGYAIAHLEIETLKPARAPFPITETGYRSHFDRADKIEAAGGPEAFARAWLDHEAERPDWKRQQEAARQGSLF